MKPYTPIGLSAANLASAGQVSGIKSFELTTKPQSSIAAAEETMRAAINLAQRVESVIDRLCGHSLGMGGGETQIDQAESPPVLVRLLYAAGETNGAIGRANAALDRIDAELG